MRNVQCSLVVFYTYSLNWSQTEVLKNGSEIHALRIDMLQYFCVAIARISARLFIHLKTLPLELGMEWMSRMCVS